MSKVMRVSVLLVGAMVVLLLAGFTSIGFNDEPGDEEPPLPPRPTLTPTEVPTIEIVSADNGQQLQLHLENELEDIPVNLWAAVEWGDTNTGKWYAVNGWHGTLNSPTTQEWWVGDDMFGDGPFRWQVYEYEGGPLLLTSETFNLPESIWLRVIVNVLLDVE